MRRPPPFSALLLTLLALPAARADAAPECVNVFYDQAASVAPAYTFGRIHATFLQNLLGHFPELQQIVAPIETYVAGDVERCRATIYLGTYFDNAVPQAFLRDYQTTSRAVVWAGYNTWLLPAGMLRSSFGVRYKGLSRLDEEHRDGRGHPGYFRHFEYKGEQFDKYGAFDRLDPSRFVADWEVATYDFEPAEVAPHAVAWARHSVTGERQPYVLRNGKRWLIGDSPFSFMTEEDRYLIFADLLFDILDLPPRHPTGPRPAFLRLEDVHPMVPLWQLDAMGAMLARKGVPYAVSIVPIYTDPLGVQTTQPGDRFVALTSRPLFMEWTRAAAAAGATFVFHGLTHQYGTTPNPFNGVTGDDFEFWDRVHNTPVPRDGVPWVLARLEDGLALLDAAGIKPVAWMTPHYQASSLDYLLFGQLFTWNVGRVIYFPLTRRVDPPALPLALRMDGGGAAANGQRLALLADTVAEAVPGLLPSGQFFPYEIFGDAYGQRLVPENVGNVQPYMNEEVFQVQTVDDLIRIMRRNRVLRDSWASLFVHPFRLEMSWQEGVGDFPGDTRAIERLIDAARAYGYEFIDLKTWASANAAPLRPSPIVRTF